MTVQTPVRQRKKDEYGNPLGSWQGYGEPLRNGNGEVVMCGAGVMAPAEWFKVKALIGKRTDEHWAKGKPEGKYLGTGNYRCGRMRDKGQGKLEPCGGPMSHRGGRYRCEVRQTRGKSACEGTVTLAERIDLAVGRAWANHVSALAPDDPVVIETARRWIVIADPESNAEREEAEKALEAAQKRVNKLEEDFYVYGKMDEERFEELSEGLRGVIEAMAATLEELDAGAGQTPLMQIEDLRRTWEAAEMSDRRMLLKCAVGEKGITVRAASRQGDHTAILDRLEFDWLSRKDVTLGE